MRPTTSRRPVTGTGRPVSSAKRPRWLDLGPQEIAEIRGLPAIQMIMEWLDWERDQARSMVISSVVHDDADPKLRAGVVLAVDAIMRSLNTPAPIADMDDETYKDPARRPSRKERDAEV